MSFIITLAEFSLLIYLIFFLPRKKKKEKQKEIERRNRIAQEEEDRYYVLRDLKKKLEDNMKTYRDFIYYAESKLDTNQYGSFKEVSAYITNALEHIAEAKKVMLETATILVRDYQQDNPLHNFDWCEDRIKELESVSGRLNRLCANCSQVFSSSKMMDSSRYGRHNQAYWHRVCNQSRNEVTGFITEYKENFKTKRYEEIISIDLERVLLCIWFLAIETPFSASDYQEAKATFVGLFPRPCKDLIIADMYSKYKLGGESAIREDVKQLLEEYSQNSDLLPSVASSFMWMKAYQMETTVLQHMLSKGLEMSMPVQQRLHALTNGGGRIAENFDVFSTPDNLYFDVSALAWKDSEYAGLFDNLAFQGKNLSYSLAVRDEDKELNIPGGITIPNTERFQSKFEAVFTDEYDGCVTCKVVDSIAISGSGEEKLKGILAISSDCSQMGILIHIAKIGRKLTIKLYTLLIPTKADLNTQKQQALSLYNKLSPLTTRWESSLKEIMLVATQQLLNDAVQYSNGDNRKSEGSGPVF